MSVTDVIPDIHGQARKLLIALKNLGWQRRAMTWLHAEPDRQIVFLGDFIDRGPENATVIRIVRELMDSGRARAVMGNHELNALHFHTVDPETGLPLRPHEKKNFEQHQSFLIEFPLGASETRDVLDWMKGLPLFLEADGFRAVHAAWIQSAIDALKLQTLTGVLSDEHLIRAGREGDRIYEISEALAKGPEQRLPGYCSFTDKSGHLRHHVRLKWWSGDAKTWRDIAMSVPDVKQLPDEPLPPSLGTSIYSGDQKPVFFGHYWMSGQPELQSRNALCLDYSAGTDGPLVTYALADGSRELCLSNVIVHDKTRFP